MKSALDINIQTLTRAISKRSALRPHCASQVYVLKTTLLEPKVSVVRLLRGHGRRCSGFVTLRMPARVPGVTRGRQDRPRLWRRGSPCIAPRVYRPLWRLLVARWRREGPLHGRDPFPRREANSRLPALRVKSAYLLKVCGPASADLSSGALGHPAAGSEEASRAVSLFKLFHALRGSPRSREWRLVVIWRPCRALPRQRVWAGRRRRWRERLRQSLDGGSCVGRWAGCDFLQILHREFKFLG